MCVLGKEMRLRDQILCDTATRLAETKALLRAILNQAQENERRLVFVAAIQRALGIVIFVTGQAPILRAKTRGLIKALTAAGTWDRHRPPPKKNLNAAWRMGQYAYYGAATLRSNDQSSINKWLDEWQYLPLGATTSLPRSCDLEIEALLCAIDNNNQMAFMPRRSPELAKDTVYIMSDSAGLSEEEPDSFRGAGAWLYAQDFTETPWMQECWCPPILLCAHSTAQEAASGLANLIATVAAYPRKKLFIEVYDSAATVDTWRSGSSASFEVRKILLARGEFLAAHPHIRVMVFWQERVRPHYGPTLAHRLRAGLRSV